MAAKKKAKPAKQAKSAKSKKPAKSAKSAKPAKAVKTKKVAKTTKSAKPVASAKPLKSAKPTRATQMPKRGAMNWHQLISPLGDRLVIEPQPMMEKTAGGLYVPATVHEKPLQGRVLAKGQGRRNRKGQVRPLDVSVGDEVMFAPYSGTSTEIAGQEVLILREDEVLGIVT